ncbi:hypothetical protein, partial [Kitasatospora sp. NPDC047058]|uniref:hypothetical protein n=1 Tax=Kitasatospora sp. NPDC047058 TaxID=3155620 RepID=UPI0033C09BCB
DDAGISEYNQQAGMVGLGVGARSFTTDLHYISSAPRGARPATGPGRGRAGPERVRAGPGAGFGRRNNHGLCNAVGAER